MRSLYEEKLDLATRNDTMFGRVAVNGCKTGVRESSSPGRLIRR
jgi:hypothetical protein